MTETPEWLPDGHPTITVAHSPNWRARTHAPWHAGTIHCTASDSYEGAVSWLCNPKADASCTAVFDWEVQESGWCSITRLIPWRAMSWAQLTANPWIDESLELVAKAGLPRDYWIKHRQAQLTTLAWWVAQKSSALWNPIPILHPDPPKHREPGMIVEYAGWEGHHDLNYWGFPESHTDPHDLPWDVVLDRANVIAKQRPAPASAAIITQPAGA